MIGDLYENKIGCLALEIILDNEICYEVVYDFSTKLKVAKYLVLESTDNFVQSDMIKANYKKIGKNYKLSRYFNSYIYIKERKIRELFIKEFKKLKSMKQIANFFEKWSWYINHY